MATVSKAVGCQKPRRFESCPLLHFERNKMEKEIEKTIKIKAYIGKHGKPTCAMNFRTGQIFNMLLTSGFGTREHCALDSQKMLRRMMKPDGEVGYLIPGKECPIWNEIEE